MKYFETKGKYVVHLLVLDSPILSLKEKKYDISEKEKTIAGMRESLIRYIMDNCRNNQIIIAENEFPENVDYSKVHQLEFTISDGEGERYSFLRSVRN